MNAPTPFQAVPLQGMFNFNGTLYRKRSTRTAEVLISDDNGELTAIRIFYFGHKEQVDMINSAPAASYNAEIQLADPYSPEESDPVIRQALKILALRLAQPGEALTGPNLVVSYLKLQLAQLQRETFACVWLDNQHRVIKFQPNGVGTVDSASVWPREVLKDGLACNAAAVILSHNHPSGIVEPSEADLRLTRKLKEVLGHVGIRVLDHVIVGGDAELNWCSMASRGLI